MKNKISPLATLALLSSLYVVQVSAYDTVISTNTTTPLLTSTSGSILIDTTGSIVVNSAVNPVITMDTASKSVENKNLVEQDGTASTILVTGAGGTGTRILNDSTGTIRGKQINDVIFVNTAGITIVNDGIIETTSIAGNSYALRMGKDFNSITNAGTLSAISGTAFSVSAANASGDILNTGTIESGNGTLGNWAYLLDSQVIYTGTFTNEGLIYMNGPDQNSIAAAFYGDFGVFNNKADGVIQGDNKALALQIWPDGSTPGGTFNNEGLIQAKLGDAIQFANTSDIFNNSGIIKNIDTAEDATVYVLNNNTVIVNGFVNSGQILAFNPVTDLAIDFATSTGTQIKLFQNGGLISGNVLLASNGGDVLELNGGTIDGDVTAYAGKANTLALNAGTVTGTLQLGDQGDTVTLKDASMQQILGGTGNDQFYMYGGGFTLIDGAAGANAMQIKGTNTVTFNNPVTNVQTIQVSAPFVANSTITNLDTLLQVDLNTSMLVDGSITGNAANFTNNGNVRITSDGIIDLPLSSNVNSSTSTLTLDPKLQPHVGATDNFNLIVNNLTQQAQSNLIVYINNTQEHGAIKALGATILANQSIITPYFDEVVFTPIGTAFPTIISPSSSIVDNGVVIVNPFLLPYFRGEINPALPGGLSYDLVLYRHLISGYHLDPIAQSIAPTIDQIIQNNGFGNPEFQNLILQLDHIYSIDQLNDALDALSPDVSYGMIEGAHIGMDRTFHLIWQRLEDVLPRNEWGYADQYRSRPDVLPNSYPTRDLERLRPGMGFSSGDDNRCPYGIWIAPYGEWSQQNGRRYNHGYKANALGLAVGYDRTFLNGTVWGMAGSFTRVRVVGLSDMNNVDYVSSLQGTIYGMWQPLDSVYVDLMAGVASNKFQNTRHVHIGNIDLDAFSSFYGWQYGGQLDIGYVDCQEGFIVVPLGRIKANYLHLQSFSEKNAGSLGLTTHETSPGQFMAGGGFRLAKEFIGYPYSVIPELSAVYLYDFIDQAQQTVANFLGGGTAFPTVGVRPGRNVFLIDLALEAFNVDNNQNIITARYELELRERYIGNSGYIQYYYRWF